MPLSVYDSNTWEASELATDSGPVTYWALADWESYYEQFEDKNNLTRILIAVEWQYAKLFRRTALGYATIAGGSVTYLNRVTPLECPYQKGQYLTSLKKHSVHAGIRDDQAVMFHEPGLENWPTFPAGGGATGFPARIVYDATFAVPPYDVVTQTAFTEGAFKEQIRYVERVEQVNPRERKLPSHGFETDEATPQIIAEVGFVPYFDYEFTLIWHKVPYYLVPWTAIADCLLKVNDDAFDYPKDPDGERLVGGFYGRYLAGDVQFRGLANKVTPYRGPHGEWLTDLPYVFAYQPADGGGDGMLKVPRNDGTWVKVRERGSAADPKYLYQEEDLDALFQPEPG